MSRVFVVNEPLKINRAGERGRAIDLRPAEKFGELVFLAPAGEPAADPSAWLTEMRTRLLGFDPVADYLLPVGHPALIVAAAALLGRKPHISEVRVLLWRGRELGYSCATLPLFSHHPQSPETVE